MDKVIDIGALTETFRDLDRRDKDLPWRLEDILAVIDHHSDEAREIVYCKDCKFAYINDFSMKRGEAVCGKWYRDDRPAITEHHDFCSLGRRREQK